MTTSPDREPDPGTAADPTTDPTDALLPAARASALPYTDPVEEQGVRFAQEADQDVSAPPAGTDAAGPGGLTPDFLAPAPPAPPA